MRLGVFGGTFNPVHYGHLRAAEEALLSGTVDRVLFVPAGNPPLKEEGLVPVEGRMAMVELAISGNPAMEISAVEASSSGKSYTVDTLRKLSALHPDDTLVFILGLDAFCDMHLWKDPGELVSLADFLVMSRPGHAFASISRLPYADVSRGSLEAMDSAGARGAEGSLRGGRRLHLLRITEMGVSASAIRGLVTRGESIRYLLPESVESFIMSHGLYAASATGSNGADTL